jgi:glyoxylase-like metal-dependent hydrolase (beta-lactamase superfamily II)
VASLQLVSRPFGPFEENTLLILGPVDASGKRRAVVVDPGMSTSAECAEFDAWCASLGATVADVLLTHAHLDHVAGAGHVFRTTGLRPRLHPDDRTTYDRAPVAAALYGVSFDTLPEPIEDLADGQVLDLFGCDVHVAHCPGHAPGHVVFYSERDGWLVGGDVLFRGSVGRTDLPGGDGPVLAAALHRVVYSLPDATEVWPGHGPTTTVGEERRTNPFVNGARTGMLDRT